MKTLLTISILSVLSVFHLFADDIILRNGVIIKNCKVIDTVDAIVRFKTTHGERTMLLKNISSIISSPFDPLLETQIEGSFTSTLSFSASQSLAQINYVRLISLTSDTLNVCKIDSSSDTVLFFSCKDKAASIPIDSIASIHCFKKGHFMKGAAIGAFIGAPLGVIIGMLTFKQNSSSGSQYSGFANFGPMLDLGAGLIGGIIGFLIGGLISSTSYEHIEFDLRNIKLLATKLLVIQQARIYCNKN